MRQSHPKQLAPFASISASSGTFNSLFKVLFIFPSWYLFAIGLEPIFSFRWNLPPALRSNPEERDSSKVHRARRSADDKRDSHPHWRSFPRGLHLRLRWQYIYRLHVEAASLDFHTELFPVHSPLLRESCLVCYPPLTYMLKFSGFADLNSCLGEGTCCCNYRLRCNPCNKGSAQLIFQLHARTTKKCLSCVRGAKRTLTHNFSQLTCRCRVRKHQWK
jgi:hypothetical protein